MLVSILANLLPACVLVMLAKGMRLHCVPQTTHMASLPVFRAILAGVNTLMLWLPGGRSRSMGFGNK